VRLTLYCVGKIKPTMIKINRNNPKVKPIFFNIYIESMLVHVSPCFVNQFCKSARSIVNTSN